MAKRAVCIGLRGSIMKIKAECQNVPVVQLSEKKRLPALSACAASIKNRSLHQKAAIGPTVTPTDSLYCSRQSSMLMLAVMAPALRPGTAVSWWLTQSTTCPLGQAVQAAQAVASSDPSSQVEVSTSDETGQLMQALKDMNASLVGIVSQVRESTDTIATASGQIAAGNQDLSSCTEQQASSLEETAASMEELTNTVKKNVHNARQANQLAVLASGVTVQGGAVVAADVRNLAQCSAAATKEIKTLIGDLVGKVEKGSQQVVSVFRLGVGGALRTAACSPCRRPCNTATGAVRQPRPAG